MPTTSAVPAFEGALITALRLRQTLAGVQVEPAWPGPETDAEGIYLGTLEGEGPVTSFTAAEFKSGTQYLDEEAEVPFVCQSYKPGGTAAEAKARAFELLSEVLAALAADPKMSSSVQWTSSVTARTLLEQFEHGWKCRLSASIQITSYLT